MLPEEQMQKNMKTKKKQAWKVTKSCKIFKNNITHRQKQKIQVEILPTLTYVAQTWGE